MLFEDRINWDTKDTLGEFSGELLSKWMCFRVIVRVKELS